VDDDVEAAVVEEDPLHEDDVEYIDECLKGDEELVVTPEKEADSVGTGVKGRGPFKESNRSPVE
jgi:hypothetical protein